MLNVLRKIFTSFFSNAILSERIKLSTEESIFEKQKILERKEKNPRKGKAAQTD